MGELSESNVKVRIERTQMRVALLFIGCIAILSGGLISGKSTGVLADLAYAIGVNIGSLGLLVFGMILFSLIGATKRALRDLPHLRSDPEAFERLYGGMLGLPRE